MSESSPKTAPSVAGELPAPESIEELTQFVKSATRLSPGSTVSLRAFDQVVEYRPDEYTISLQAGVPVSEAQRILKENGQYLPFDPLFAEQGATVGGAIATGLSGPLAYRYGILRDFIIGLNFIDGNGEHVRTGGKVVKNAAGFDLPKFMGGSLGSCGIITEATFKVFPKAPATLTATFRFSRFEEAIAALSELRSAPFALEALELSDDGTLYLCVAGVATSLPQRLEKIEKLLGETAVTRDEDDSRWREFAHLRDLPQTGHILKLPSKPSEIPRTDGLLAEHHAKRRYSLGGSVTWVQLPTGLNAFSEALAERGKAAQIVTGDDAPRIIGDQRQRAFYGRIKGALDPHGKFSDVYK